MLIIGENVNLTKENTKTEFRDIEVTKGKITSPHVGDIQNLVNNGVLSISESTNPKEDCDAVIIGSNFSLEVENSVLVTFLKDKTPVVIFEDPEAYVTVPPTSLGLPQYDEENSLVTFPLNLALFGEYTPSQRTLKEINHKQIYGHVKSATKLSEEIMLNTLFEMSILVSSGLVTFKNIKPLIVSGSSHFSEIALEKKKQQEEQETKKKEMQKKLKEISEQEKLETKLRIEEEKRMKTKAHAKKGAMNKQKREKAKVQSMKDMEDYAKIMQDIL